VVELDVSDAEQIATIMKVAWTTEWVSLIGIVATSEKHRNMGYATSVVSTIVKEFLAEQFPMIIFVRKRKRPSNPCL
jgi:predicted GNAT family acetyltransferase